MAKAWIQVRLLCHPDVADTLVFKYFLQELISLSTSPSSPDLVSGVPEWWEEGTIFLFVGVGVAVRTLVHLLYLPKAGSN